MSPSANAHPAPHHATSLQRRCSAPSPRPNGVCYFARPRLGSRVALCNFAQRHSGRRVVPCNFAQAHLGSRNGLCHFAQAQLGNRNGLCNFAQAQLGSRVGLCNFAQAHLGPEKCLRNVRRAFSMAGTRSTFGASVLHAPCPTNRIGLGKIPRLGAV
ncbi:Hypothetical protein A7982_09652 [Minicystis rosea]|nr:Hypothetical protein A7982_09652 [Minicystis rosea]